MIISGIGWIETPAHGWMRQDRTGNHHDGRDLYRRLRQDGVIPDAIKDFGRFDPDSVQLCLAAALSLLDAGIVPGSPEAAQTGLLVSRAAGAQNANLAYFRDYLVSGRTLGRGNLFIYTLPTSPAAETAIAFGLQGPLVYIHHAGGGLAAPLQDAADFIAGGQAHTMLCALSDNRRTLCFTLRPEGYPGWPWQTILQADAQPASLRDYLKGRT